MTYKFKDYYIADSTGKMIVMLMPVGCSKKFMRTAGKQLANILNCEARGNELVKGKRDEK